MTVKSQVKRFPDLLLTNRQYSGMMSTIFYNWPIFVGGLFFAGVTIVIGLLLPSMWGWLLLLAGAGTLILMLNIIVATYLVYDAGEQHDYDRLAELGDVGQANVVLDVTCGKLRGTRGLLTHFNKGHYFLIDIFNAETMKDDALTRARHLEPPLNVKHRIYRRPAQPDKLPVPHNWADVIYCSFSLHELQNAADREAIFKEFQRVLKPGGRLLIAEHGRDWLNLLAFGPGAFSFFSPTIWQQHIEQAGLTIQQHETWRGLVHLWVVGRQPTSSGK